MSKTTEAPPPIVEAQFSHVNALAGLGYEALAARDGEDLMHEVTGPNGKVYSIRTIINKDDEQQTVWVHTEARKSKKDTPWHSGFTINSAGEIEMH